jgi:hypothetical protein
LCDISFDFPGINAWECHCWVIAKLFSSLTPLYISPAIYEWPVSPHLCQHLVFSLFLVFILF